MIVDIWQGLGSFCPTQHPLTEIQMYSKEALSSEKSYDAVRVFIQHQRQLSRQLIHEIPRT